jgi:competence protein ComEC
VHSIAFVPASAVLAGVAASGLIGDGAAAFRVLLVTWAVTVASYLARRPAMLLVAAWISALLWGALLGRNATVAARDSPLTHAVASELDRPRRDAQPVWVRGRLVTDASAGPTGVSLVVATDAVERQGTVSPVAGVLRVSVAGQIAAQAAGAWRQGRAIRLPVVVRRPLAFRNPGVPDQELALARRGIALLGSTKSGALVEITSKGSAAAEAGSAARAWVRTRVSETVGAWDSRSAGIVTAILIGDRTGLSPEVEDRLQRAGTFHVIAISGGNIAVLVAVALVLVRAAGAGPRGAAMGAALVLVAYGGIAEGGSSVARAIVMGLGWLAGRALGIRGAAANLLATAALVLAIARPLLVFDPGFALSVGATLGIVLGAGRIVARPGMRPQPARSRVLARAAFGVAAATICAEIAVVPIAAFAFSQVTIAGVLLNFVAVPAMAAIQVAGTAAVVSAAGSAAVANACGLVAHLGVAALLESARLVDACPGLARRVPAPSVAVVGLYYATWGVALMGRRPVAVGGAAGLGVLLGALIFAGRATPAWPWDPEPGAGALRVTFLDVAQGDAALLQFPGGTSMLVDAGGLTGTTFDMGARVVAPALWALGVRRLDRLALTHGDPDHVGGAPSVIDAFRPRELWEAIVVSGHAPTERIRRQATTRRLAWTHAYAGTTIAEGEVELRVFHPRPPAWERRRVRNDDSIVIEVRYGAVSFVLMGDAGVAVEQELDAAIGTAPVRVLKAGHHGSADATSLAWLQRLRPGALVVSAGRNNVFGHPSPAMLARAQAAGVETFRTDRDGAVRAVADRESVEVSTWDGRRWVLRRVIGGRRAGALR